ncbi:MAG: hypothetical protein QNK97_01390 [Gammaproteobacteria bacterium]|jgi:hypothetical protein|nr:hypothetical protein [Gammaproteobacteria bacterium]
MEFLVKTDDQTVNEYIYELQDDCFRLHMFSKELVLEIFTEKQRESLFEFLMDYSDEPQYQILRLLGFYHEVNPQRQEAVLLKIFALIDEARGYSKNILTQSPEDRRIRASAEWMYLDGDSVSDIVNEMISTGLLEEYIDDIQNVSLKEAHIKRINEYVKGFPNFEKLNEIDKQDESFRHNFLDLEKVKHLDSKTDEMDTQVRSILVKHSDDSGAN